MADDEITEQDLVDALSRLQVSDLLVQTLSTVSSLAYHRLAEEHRDLVCTMNLDFLTGLLDGLGPERRLTARLEPSPGHCCVRIAAA